MNFHNITKINVFVILLITKKNKYVTTFTCFDTNHFKKSGFNNYDLCRRVVHDAPYHKFILFRNADGIIIVVGGHQPTAVMVNFYPFDGKYLLLLNFKSHTAFKEKPLSYAE